MRHLFLVFVAALVLSGCYVSKTPFITPATADYPVANGAHFDAFAPAGSGWVARPGRSVFRAGAYYVYADDGRSKTSPPFLLKRVAPEMYLVQLSDNADPAKVHEYSYELIHFDGKTAIQYSGTCPARPEWASRGLMMIEDTSTPRCIFSNLRNLAIVLQEAVKNAAPEAKYTLSSDR